MATTDVTRVGGNVRRGLQDRPPVMTLVRNGAYRESKKTSGKIGRTANDSADEGASEAEMQSLIAEAQAGDRNAFDALVRRTWVETYSLALRLMGNEEDARDVCQEAYLRAYRGLRRFRGDARFTTWLYRITANCASTHLGRRHRHRHELLDEKRDVVDESPSADPVGRAESARLRDAVQHALVALPPRLRAVVVLRDIYDLSHEVIAAELGISVSAAKVRLHRARRRLRDDVFLKSEVGDRLEERSDHDG
ncbi:MAG: RNA polymerase sigma factor [Acidimicrobiales bacterium]